MYLNKVMLAGNLTRDPELKQLPSGSKVANFSIATNRTWIDKATGQKQESVEYHNLVSFGRQAETIAQYMRKGSSIFIEGRLTTRSWDGTDGKKNYRTEVVVEDFKFVGSKSGGSSDSGAHAATQSPEPVGAPGGFEAIDYPDEDINPEDIPF